MLTPSEGVGEGEEMRWLASGVNPVVPFPLLASSELIFEAVADDGDDERSFMVLLASEGPLDTNSLFPLDPG